MNNPSLKVALVHDHLTQYGGAEQVLGVLRQIYPAAPIYTLVYDQRAMGDMFPADIVKPSFLQRLPGGIRRYQWLLPLMPWATECHNLSNYDLVISSASAFAKGVITTGQTLHVCYCHTPTRYLWSDTHNYVASLRYPGFIKAMVPALFPRLRVWDWQAAQRPDFMFANSETVRNRIKRYYSRDSVVLYPPVAVDDFSSVSSTITGSYFLTGGRLVGYKRFDIVVEAFNRLRLPLTVFGDGPARCGLEQLAKPNIRFTGFCKAADLVKLYAGCQAFIHPQVEDFGITAVEAMATGRPVIAYTRGGALETVRAGETGVFFEEQSWESLADTVARYRPADFDSAHIRRQAQRFSIASFRQRWSEEINKLLNNKLLGL